MPPRSGFVEDEEDEALGGGLCSDAYGAQNGKIREQGSYMTNVQLTLLMRPEALEWRAALEQ